MDNHRCVSYNRCIYTTHDMNGLHADSILKSYGTCTILSDIYLGCNVGEIVGLLGRNGCGKSTMLKIIFGALNAEYRFVRIGDKVQDKLSESSKVIKYLPVSFPKNRTGLN